MNTKADLNGVKTIKIGNWISEIIRTRTGKRVEVSGGEKLLCKAILCPPNDEYEEPNRWVSPKADDKVVVFKLQRKVLKDTRLRGSETSVDGEEIKEFEASMQCLMNAYKRMERISDEMGLPGVKNLLNVLSTNIQKDVTKINCKALEEVLRLIRFEYNTLLSELLGPCKPEIDILVEGEGYIVVRRMENNFNSLNYEESKEIKDRDLAVELVCWHYYPINLINLNVPEG